MAAAFLRVLGALLIAGLALACAFGITRAQDNAADEPPAQADPAQEDNADEDAAAAADEEAEEADEAPPEAEGVLRRRPRTAAEERAWKEMNAPRDPFLFVPDTLGPAPGVGEFYNPQDFVDPQVSPGISRYIIQDGAGGVVGYLTLALKRTMHREFGECVEASLYYDDDDPAELTLWLDPETLQPLRLERQQRLVPGARAAAPEAGGQEEPANPEAGEPVDPAYTAKLSQLQQLQHDRVEYRYDRVRHWRSKGAVSLAPGILRQRPFSYELAQLPVLARQLRPHGDRWPFTAPLVDGMHLRTLELAVPEPSYVNVMSAEPAACQCYELRFQYGGEEQVFWVERSLPRRLIKFTAGGRTYNLFEYAVSE